MLLGNKMGFMLHLPVANGPTTRTLHRSKWYGASQLGRKLLEALVCYGSEGQLLCRRVQTGFNFDGVVAERMYRVGGSGPPVDLVERYFVPDFVPAIVWQQLGAPSIVVEPRFELRFARGSPPLTPYMVDHANGAIVVSREVPLETDEESGASGVAPGSERLYAACTVVDGEMQVRADRDRFRAVWYGSDAARRRYLRRASDHGLAAVEHAPRWERAGARTYSPVTIEAAEGAVIILAFGNSWDSVLENLAFVRDRAEHLEVEKRDRLGDHLQQAFFASGHERTDQAYGHVLSRVIDCMVVERSPAEYPGDLAPVGTALLAGNAYFQEAWKRDENIALGGILAAGLYDVSRRILDDTWQRQDEDTGRLPLRLRPGEATGYTSSDATLWALWRLAQYVRCSGDDSLLESKLPLVVHFFHRSLSHCWHGLLPSGGIAIAGHDWETWMDTEFSPRVGYPIEIQLLWLACLCAWIPPLATIDAELAAAMTRAAQDLRHSLGLLEHDGYLVDYLTLTLEQVELFTPNGFFWSILDLDMGWEAEERMLWLAREELAGVSGIRSLARSQWAQVLGPEIAGLARPRRPLPSVGKINYHRGVEWNWLAQLFVAGELNHGRPDVAFDRYLATQLRNVTTHAGLGGVSELFDNRGPAGPRFQTWSMTGLLESLRRFAGVTIDVPKGEIAVRPQKPRRWPYVRSQHWFGAVPFTLEYMANRWEQWIALEFEERVSEPVEIRVELVVPVGRRPRRLLVRDEQGEPQPYAWVELSEPHRVQVNLPVRPRLELRLQMRPIPSPRRRGVG